MKQYKPKSVISFLDLLLVCLLSWLLVIVFVVLLPEVVIRLGW